MQEIDTSKAHPARMYDFLLGGKDHFDADRQAIAGLLKAVPNARSGAREDGRFPEAPGLRPLPSEVAYYGAVGRKPGSDG